jgi:hypothetical protein
LRRLTVIHAAIVTAKAATSTIKIISSSGIVRPFRGETLKLVRPTRHALRIDENAQRGLRDPDELRAQWSQRAQRFRERPRDFLKPQSFHPIGPHIPPGPMLKRY